MRRSTLSIALVATAFLALTGLGAWLVQRGGGDPPAALAVSEVPEGPALPEEPSPDAAPYYVAAAEAFRSDDLPAVRRHLAELREQFPTEADRSRVVLGLYELLDDNHEQALRWLGSVEATVAGLEDWRLYGLSQAAARLDHDATAAEALSTLLAAQAGSPLVGSALATAAELAFEREDFARALELVEMARGAGVEGPIATQLDLLAWRVGTHTRSAAVKKAAAKRLLVHSPAEARKLRVADVFRDSEGNIDYWQGILTTEQVLQRTEAWLEDGDGRAAAITLATVPAVERGFEWHLLQAKALTRQGRGGEAYQHLRAVSIRDARQYARLEWERAMAAADLATAKRGRDNLGSEDRERMLGLAQRHLRRVVELNADVAISINAVRELYGYLAEQGRFDESMDMLALLRHLDPQDRTGASYLWGRGWEEFQTENYSGAIGYWTQLEELYPGDRETHRGRYWKGRALEELGQIARGQEVYRELVRTSDTADFYVRQAMTRMVGDVSVPTSGRVAPVWPADAPLRRVMMLINFGLDPLAELELGILERSQPTLDGRDSMALSGILEVRAGNPRQAVQSLRAAFPDLGGPYQGAVPRPVLEAYYPLVYEEPILRFAEQRELPPSLVAGIIRQESAFDSRATSWAGARGLMQLMPATAKEWARRLGKPYSPERLYDPDYSIQLGTAYFRYVLNRFDGNVELALAGYNGGPNRIRRLWNEAGPNPELDLFLENLGIPESQAYVKRILILADSYRQLYPGYGVAASGPATTPAAAG